MKNKKILSLLLTLAMLCSLTAVMGVPALAGEPYPCDVCDGQAEVYEVCPNCGRNGKQECELCHGDGWTTCRDCEKCWRIGYLHTDVAEKPIQVNTSDSATMAKHLKFTFYHPDFVESVDTFKSKSTIRELLPDMEGIVNMTVSVKDIPGDTQWCGLNLASVELDD